MIQNRTSIEKLKNGRPTIAVLVASMNSFYQEGIMRGAADGAEELGYNLIVYSGGPFKSPHPIAQSRESVFDLVEMDLIDGVIVPVSSHTRYLNQSETEAFVGRYSSVPIINLSSSIEGCTNIIPDFNSGLEQLMDHYVNDHGYRKIAFFRGPCGHLASEARTFLFKEQLKKHNLPVDEDLIIYSDYGNISADRFIAELLDDRKVDCDAIITLNDNLALSVIKALSDRGIRVPEDIAVSGTMDDSVGLYSQPPLTTIKEPIYELGKLAVHTLKDIFKGKIVPRDIYIPTSLVKRKSCGCKSTIQDTYKGIDSLRWDLHSAKTSSLPGERDLEKSCLDLLKQSRCFGDSQTLHSLLEEYKLGKGKSDFSSFYDKLNTQMVSVVQTEKVMGWLAVVSRIQLDLVGDPAEETRREDLSALLIRLIALKTRIEDMMAKYQKYELEYYNSFFTYILNTLNTSFNVGEIKTSTMDLLNISDFYISVYTSEKGNVHNRFAKNIISVRNRDVIEVEEECRVFPAKQLIPSCIEPYAERYSLMVFPLSFRKKPLGFLTLDLSACKGSVFENLQVIISAALKNELQIQDLKKAEERFSDIAHNTSNWLWETDASYCFTYSSLSVLEILGYTDEDMLKRGITDFSLPDSDTFFQRMLNQESLSDVECWFKHRNGNLICLLISGMPIKKRGLFSGYRGVFKDITDQKFQEEKINHLAYFDILTDLPNRAMFQEKMENLLNVSSLNNKNFALMFIDIDRFKYINDSMGHESGDLLLKQVGERLNESIRGRDVLARLGGDDFAIILPDIDDSQVIMIGERILKNLFCPIELNGTQIHTTVSLGIAMYPQDGTTTVSLLKRAHNAMHQAKQQGRNGYVFYDRKIEEKNTLRKQHEENLYSALEKNSFILYYQPQVNAETGDIEGLEALVRIKKGEEIIYPDNFIYLAEELGLVRRIDEWVFRESCRQSHLWREKGFGKVRISVNISARQLRNGDIVSDYLQIMEEYGVEPEDIKLEVTENVLIDNEDMALDILTRFKNRGVSIVLDDFGTGYSSLQFINRYPIDTVKIDKSFVRGAFSNKKSEAIIKAMIHLARSLDMSIIAEGVETEEQYEFIKSLGCDEIQGFYFYKPSSVEDLEAVFLQAL
jgi:diguanylate cyclase (GGDEF)-like protein/PAS domain S-box-containing protein